jgi:hypothetical protein
MADYFEQTVVQQTIPDADMTPLERLLLSRIFQSEPHGDGWYFFAEESPSTMIVVSRAELDAALASSPDVNSAARSASAIDSERVNARQKSIRQIYTFTARCPTEASRQHCHFVVCLKYRKSGGGWSFRAGINRPSALRK